MENNVSRYNGGEKLPSTLDELVLDEKKSEEMKELFATAESAMEAWAMLATSLGHPSFIKSEFEKICFLDNATTDTQVTFYLIGDKLTFRYNFLILEPISFTAPHYLIFKDYFILSLSCRYLQVAIWRDSARRRLVIAFRGTEQVSFIYLFSY